MSIETSSTACARREEPSGVSASAGSGHLPALDAVRGLAIVAVTIYRFGAGDQFDSLAGRLFSSVCAVGMRGVDLFFVLSGFLITGILFDAKGQSNYFRNFFARRTLRIFPLYFAVLLVALVLLPAVSPWWRTLFPEALSHASWLWCYGANVKQSLDGAWNLGRFDHFWSLAVEEHFYLVWPFVIFLTSRVVALRISLGLVIGVPVARLAWIACGGNLVAPEVLTIFRMDALAWGAMIALAARGPGGIGALLPDARRGIVLFGVLVAALCVFPRRLGFLPEAIWAGFFACLLVTIVAARPATRWHSYWQSRTLRFFGKYSYGMYVFQNLLIPIAAPICSAEILARALGSPLAGRLGYIAILFALTTACALTSWHLLEKHALKLKRHFGEPRFDGPHVAAAPALIAT